MKAWLCLWVLLGLGGLAWPAWAQPLAAGWQADPLLRGLALRTLAQAPDGLLWLGTENGAFRYDGTDVVPLNALRRSGPPLPAVACTQLLALPNGDVWLGTEAGAFRFTAAGALCPVPLPSRTRRVVSSLDRAPDGRVWLAQERIGLQAYTPDGQPSGSPLPVPDPHLELWAAPDNSLWVQAETGRTEHRAATGQLLGAWAHPGRTLLPVADRRGQVLLLSNRAAYRPAARSQLPEAGRWRPPGPEEPFNLTRTDTSATLLAWDQLLHLGWTPAGPRIRFTLTALPIPPARWGGRIITDASGHWWLFNTGVRGCWRRSVTPAFIRPLARADGRSYSVRAIARLPDGRLLVSSYDGVLVQAAGAPLGALRPLPATMLPDGRLPVLMAMVPAGLGPAREWVTGCAGPFLAFDPRTGRVRPLPVAGLRDGAPEVRCLARDPATGRVWGGTVAGLYELDSVVRQFRPYRPAGAPATSRPRWRATPWKTCGPTGAATSGWLPPRASSA